MNAKRRIPRRIALAATTAAGLLLLALILLPDPPVRASDSSMVAGSVRPERQTPEDIASPDGEPKSTAAGAREPVKGKLSVRLSALGWSCQADRIAGSSAEGSVTLTRSDGVTLVAEEVKLLASGEVVGFGLSKLEAEGMNLQDNRSLVEGDHKKQEGFRIDRNGKILARHGLLRKMLNLGLGDERPF